MNQPLVMRLTQKTDFCDSTPRMRHKHLSDSAVSEQCPNRVSQLQLSSRGLIERAFWQQLSNPRGKIPLATALFSSCYTAGVWLESTSGGNPWFAV